MRKIKNTILVLLLASFILSPFMLEAAVTAKKKKTRCDFTYAKLADGTKVLTTKIFTKKGPVFTYIENADIHFYAKTDTTDLTLGVIKTDKDGKAFLYIDKAFEVPMDEEGLMHFAFAFEGNDTLKAKSEDLDIMDLNLSFVTEMDEDSIRYINAVLLNSVGEPVEGEEVAVSVRRLYSYLPIESDYSNRRGKVSVEFPSDLPGDSLGVLDILVKVAESDLYGTVESRVSIDWGVPVDYSIQSDGRELWTDRSPLWMIIAIYIVLIGAWSQFFVAMYFLFKMRKA